MCGVAQSTSSGCPSVMSFRPFVDCSLYVPALFRGLAQEASVDPEQGPTVKPSIAGFVTEVVNFIMARYISSF